MNSTSSPRVGFIGLGSQGGPMARRIIEAGYPVTLWARRPATLEPFADTNAKIAGSPADLAAAPPLADADLASAQAAFNRGNLPTARQLAARAKGRFAIGSPGWVKADDIASFKPQQTRRLIQ